MRSERMYDHSTFEGKIQQIIKRISNWSWYIVPVALIAGLLLMFAILTPQQFDSGASSSDTPNLLLSSAGENGIDANPNLSKCSTDTASFPGDASNLKNGTFLFRPLGVSGLLRNYSGLYAGLTEIDKAYLRKVELHDVIIDAPLLSLRLQNSPDLQTLILDHVAVSGNFSRVLLPNIKDFSYNQIRNAATDTYKSSEALHSILFFDLAENKVWDLEKDLLNLGVNIKVSVGGTTILDINRSEGKVNLNVKTCKELYENLDLSGQAVTSLSLAWCPVNQATGLPLSTLNYLNLNNAVPPTDVLAQVLHGAVQLQEFHAFLPDPIPISINLTHFPNSIQTVSLSKLEISELPQDFLSPIQSLALEMVDLTGILPNFHKNFANLSKVAIFNASSTEQGYGILEEILKTNASLILLPYFSRNSSFGETEIFLTQIGLSETDEDFVIEKDVSSGKYVGRSLTPFETHFARYNLFAFNDIDNFEDYMYWDAVFKTGHKHLRAWKMPIGV